MVSYQVHENAKLHIILGNRPGYGLKSEFSFTAFFTDYKMLETNYNCNSIRNEQKLWINFVKK